MARQIVEGYFRKHKITGEEIDEDKRIILKGMLKGSVGKFKNLRIADLMINMEKSGLSKQKVYSIIINLALNRIKVEGHIYSSLAIGSTSIDETMSEKMRAAAVLLTEVEGPTRIYRYFENLGLLNYIRDEKGKSIYSDSNLYMAYQIVEGYFGRKRISDEERAAILRCILKRRVLSNKRFGLWELMQNLLKSNLGKSEIYAVIINLSVNDNINEYSYEEVLRNSEDEYQHIVKSKGPKKRVSEETIQKALEKCNRWIGLKEIAAAALPAICTGRTTDEVEADLNERMLKGNKEGSRGS